MNVGAVVLCGGRSSRMGRPKALLPFGPEVMLQRVVRLVREVAGVVVVVAAPGQELPSLPGGVVITRDESEGRGPLQGFEAGLSSVEAAAQLVYVTACDVPFLRPAWILRLAELIGDHAIAMPRVGGFDQPLAALYRPVSVLPAVRRLIAAGRMRPFFLTEALPTRFVTGEELQVVDPARRTLQNLNTPADYEAALREAGFA